MILQNKIPSIYHSIFPELLGLEFPEEKIATCDTCTLCRSPQSPYINTKCCTYQPTLVNFLLGGVFTDDDVSLRLGKERILNQIKARSGVTPYGIIPSLSYIKREKEANSIDFWLRPHKLVESIRCPYSYEGLCTIWKYRENLCVTFFCSSIAGVTGKTFWKKVNTYLKMAETSLAQYAMLQLGWPPSKIKTDAVTAADFKFEEENGIINDAKYAVLWGDWIGREEEFYRSCFNIIKNIDARTYKQITGQTREILEASIRDTQKDFLLSNLPDFLLLHPGVIADKSNEDYILLVLGEISAKITPALLPLIHSFNGKRQTVEVFQLGYNILFNMSDLVDELREKGILIKP